MVLLPGRRGKTRFRTCRRRFSRSEFIIFRLRRTHRKGSRLKKNSGRRRLRLPAGVASAFLLTGCLYSTHHFNSGRLLEPGHSSVTLGAGRSATVGYGCPETGTDWQYRDSSGLRCVKATFVKDSNGFTAQREEFLEPGPTSTPYSNASLGYRLGIHGRWGPFTGAEIGLHLEAPTNPVSGEFDLKLGLPVPASRPYHHSLSAGWSIGIWADNSYFLEYAASRAWGENDLFVNYRATYLASQYADLSDAESSRHFDSHQRLIHQAALGFKWTLPEIPVLPDFVAPEVGLTYPLGPTESDKIPAYVLDDRMWNLSMGMGWHFR
jgi:hypothetical protein